MKCGLIVLNYKDFRRTQTLLDTIKDFPELDYIVVVDNASPNESYEELRKYQSDKISILQSGKNGGYSYGNNFGAKFLIEKINPDIIGIANPDVIFDNNLVKRIKELFASHSDYAVLSGFQLNIKGEIGDHPFWNNESSAFSLYMQQLIELLPYRVWGYKRHESYRNYLETVRHSTKELNRVWATEGSLFFIRTRDFEAVGMFDENVFMYYEENILAYKLHKIRKKVGVINTATYIHAHETNSNIIDSSIKARIESNNSREYYLRHYPLNNKLKYVFYKLLAKLCWYKQRLKQVIKKLCKKIFYCLKR